MTSIEDLERRIRERGVRVDERLALLRVLKSASAEEKLEEKQESLLDAVRKAASRLKGSVG